MTLQGDSGAGTMPWETYKKLSSAAQLYCRYQAIGEGEPEPQWNPPNFSHESDGESGFQVSIVSFHHTHSETQRVGVILD